MYDIPSFSEGYIQTFHQKTCFSFFSVHVFSIVGKIFHASVFIKLTHSFLFDSLRKTEKIDAGVFRYFISEPSYSFYNLQNWRPLYVYYLAMSRANQGNKI